MVGVLGVLNRWRPVTKGFRLKHQWPALLATFAGVGGRCHRFLLLRSWPFASVANAGILSSSRYPMAMGRDHLTAFKRFRRLDRRGTPVIAVVIVSVVAIVILRACFSIRLKIAKLASAFLS